ncbi:hypothetical protein K7472_10815 [Streptomyces sp. PTM05]|uniref:Uncharacterized protein n=1 Tax=Streptantibioticus parmotrematis TaxID=2873249 RepID=A0ABS7QQ61_9ACTN|nr:hypothetical protein [Streptantibioticus parmotrematis]MBY8885337.1 hypothetical protein [Streptantibioticus parmotrematis]
MEDLYRDGWITCTESGVVIRWYYLWGSRTIPYATIRSARRVRLTPLHGRARVWGTANPRYWASLDPGRPRKDTALILDVGKAVHPFITPQEVPEVERIIRERAGLPEATGPEVGPII